MKDTGLKHNVGVIFCKVLVEELADLVSQWVLLRSVGQLSLHFLQMQVLNQSSFTLELN